MYTEFKKFLLSIGFNNTGATEIITRLEQDRADRYDKDLYKRYLRESQSCCPSAGVVQSLAHSLRV